MRSFFFPDLSIRSTEDELMDLPDCNKKKLINTVKQFILLNFLFTRSRALIKKYIVPHMFQDKYKLITFLDIGAGGCDIPIWLLGFCKKKGLSVKITCLDSDKRIIEYARKKCKSIKEIEIIEASAFDLKNLGKFDYIFANHFLHHLQIELIPTIIDLIHKQTNRVFLLNDIYRSNLAYLGYTLFTGVFMHNSFAFYDGRLSIKRGFIDSEIIDVINKSKSKNHIEFHKIKPARIYIIGSKVY